MCDNLQTNQCTRFLLGNYEKDMIFIQLLRELKIIGNKPVVVTETVEIFIGTLKLVSGSCTIIDDILLLCSNLDAVLLYLECTCRVFQKYCVSFRQDKCDLIKYRIEYVGHDVTEQGNLPAQYKFYLINYWVLSKNGQALFSFIGLVNFYHRYAPYFEIRMKPLRRFLKLFNCNKIAIMAWNP